MQIVETAKAKLEAERKEGMTEARERAFVMSFCANADAIIQQVKAAAQKAPLTSQRARSTLWVL